MSQLNPPSGATLKHIAKHWGVLILCLTDGRIEMDQNTVERTIRPIAIGRRHRILAGVQRWVIQTSLIENCRVDGIEPHIYMTRRLTLFLERA
ncbi:transposase [Sulfitobacter pontiacus]|uniref:IS66 family transposase n=1 Tax=Sulfitobacter pontiacus TaxID=60137 RepID=UPI000562C6A6